MRYKKLRDPFDVYVNRVNINERCEQLKVLGFRLFGGEGKGAWLVTFGKLIYGRRLDADSDSWLLITVSLSTCHSHIRLTLTISGHFNKVVHIGYTIYSVHITRQIFLCDCNALLFALNPSTVYVWQLGSLLIPKRMG